MKNPKGTKSRETPLATGKLRTWREAETQSKKEDVGSTDVQGGMPTLPLHLLHPALVSLAVPLPAPGAALQLPPSPRLFKLFSSVLGFERERGGRRRVSGKLSFVLILSRLQRAPAEHSYCLVRCSKGSWPYLGAGDGLGEGGTVPARV